MKILLFIPSLLGGAEKVSILYGKILKQKGFNVKFVILDRGKTSLLSSYLSEDIPRITIKCKHTYMVFSSICNIFNKEKPDIVFSSLTVISFFLVLARFFTNSKVKIIYRHCFKPGTENFLIHYIIKYVFPFVDLNISQTDEMRLEMLNHYGLKPDKVVTINNPLDEDDIKNKIANNEISSIVKNKFVAIGRVAPVKDYRTMIVAFSKVVEKLPDATLSIFGAFYDLEYKKDLEKLISDLSLFDKVFFMGATDNPFLKLLNHDVFVMSSISEGLPNALIEAMYLNIPVAVTNCIPFIDSKIRNGENGFKAEVQNSESLSVAMLSALNLKGKIKNENENDKIKQDIISTFVKIYGK